MPVNNTIKLRRGDDWSSNPVLSQGEPGFDTTNNILKIGDGTTAWSGLNPIGSGLNYLQSHPNISAASSSNNSGRTYIQDILLDNNGHVIGITTATESGAVTETNDLSSSVTWVNVPDANITESSVIQHSGALRLTESQIVDLQNYLTSFTETNDLSSAVTWANVPDTNITESSVVQHTGALLITESQIVDLQNYLTSHPTIASAASSSDNSGRTYIQDILLDSNGHVIGITTATETVTDTNTEYTAGTGLSLESTEFNINPDLINSRTEVTSEDSDYLLIWDATDSQLKKVDAGEFRGGGGGPTLTQEEVEDFVGGMVTGNTETGITVTYQDADGTLDFVVASQTDENFTTADHSKLDGIEAGADVTDTANVTSAGALMDSEVTNLSQVKAFDSSDYATASQGTKADTAQQPPSEGAFVDGDKTKLDGIEAAADVTDTANVNAAGAVMNSDTTTVDMSFVIDEDNMTSNSDTKVPTQQSVKAYVDANGGGGGISNIVEDTTPQLGGNLDAQSNNISSVGSLTATSLIKSGGTSSQFLKADGSVDTNTYLTSFTETNDLSAAVTWTNVPDANITQGSVTQHQAALSITESQISDLQSYLTSYTETDTLANVTSRGNTTTTTCVIPFLYANQAAFPNASTYHGAIAHSHSDGAMYFAHGGNWIKLANDSDILNEEKVEDFVGGMLTGNTETGITVTYDDSDGTIDFVVASQTDENFTTADHSKLDGIEAGADVTDATNVDNAGAVMNTDSSTASMSFVVDEDDMTSDSDTKVPTQQSVKAYVDANAGGATLTEEQVEDFVGGMVTGNTETGITVTYQDADGTLDFVVASQTDENFTTADHSKLDGIEANADVTDTDNVTSAGALMDSELTDLAGVKGVTISTLQVKPSEGAFVDGDKTKLDGIEASADVTDTANVTTAGALMDSEVTNLAQVKAFDSSDYATAAQGTKADSAQQPPSEGAFANGDKTKLDSIEASADVTDTANVTSAGALMDSEVTNLAQVKAFDSSDYATAAQGTKADSAQQPPSEGAFVDGDKTKLDAIEAGANVTDATNVDAAGAVMNSDTSTASMSFVVDEDNMSSDSDTKVPTQQSVKSYIDNAGYLTAHPNISAASSSDNSGNTFIQDLTLDSNGHVTDITVATATDGGGGGGISNVVEDTTPQLGGDLGLNSKTIDGTGAIDITGSGHFSSLVRADSFIKDGGTSSQFLKADGSVDTNTYSTTDTQLTEEQVEDFVGGMVTGNTETGITVTYDDSDGTLDFVVASQTDENFTTADHAKLDGIEANADVTDTANVTTAGALMDSEVTNLSQVKAFDSSDYATAAQGTKADSAQQPPSEGAFANGDKTKLDGIEAGATADQTDEEIQDIVGAMLTGNTETGITVTYQDADGTIDFAVASQTDENFTTADHSKLDGIEASADVTDTANVTSAGALMDSELASIADVKALDQSVIAGASPNFVTTNMTDASDKRFMTDAQETKLDSVESNADVTDTANVTAAGALMDSELTDLAGVKGVTISTLQVKPSEGAFANGDKTKLDGIEANATADQTDEEIQDVVGAMLTGNTETGITVTYQDADGTIDFVVASQTDENFTTADHSKLDGIEAGADVTDTANVTAAGALMDSELTDLAGVKGVTISTLQVKPSEGAFANGDKTKLDGIEASADVTDATNVDAAGAVMNSDSSTASMSFVVDEDNMSSDSATKVPTQQSVKAYVDANAGGGGSMTTVKGNGSQVGGADIVTLDFSSEFAVTESPDTEINIALSDDILSSGDLSTTLSGSAGISLAYDSSADAIGLNVDINGSTDLAAPAVGDELIISDASDSNSIKKADVASVVNLADHDALTNFVANEHIDHTSVTLTAGDGLTGGGDISANRTFAVSVDDSTIEINSDALRIKDGAITSAKIGAGGFVFNEAGAAVDFRVEGDTDTDLFLVDGSEDTVQIGKLNINGAFTLPTSDGSANQILKTDGNGTVSWAADGGGGGGGGGGSMTTVKANGSQVGGADIVTLDFASNFAVTETPDTEVNIDLSSSINTQGITATTGLIVGVSGLHHQSGTIVHSTEAAWGDFPGNAQNSINLLTGKTTNATFTSLPMNNGMYSGVKLPSNKTFFADVNIVGRRTNGGQTNKQHAAYQLKACITNDAFGRAVVGSVNKTVIAESNSAWDVQLAFAGGGSGQTDFLLVQCKGAASTNVNWVAKVDLLEVGGLNETSAYREANILTNMSPELIP